jgi:PelA/Pel-15E family pectate lyase
MKRAATFMVERVATQGGYVWSYLPDLSRRWGEIEARASMIWLQPPGTPSMGHLFLDAYHATGDAYYLRAAEDVARALITAQHPAGGWNYVHDTAGEASRREWYDTVGRNAWRLEEFQHDWGNATFDDGGTSQSALFLLRLYLDTREPAIKAALDKAIQFVLDSQYPVGAWPQRFPLNTDFSHQGKPDYTPYLTFNDDVAAGNVNLLIACYQALGDRRLLDPIARGMRAFVVTQQPAPQAGWALQYTPDLKPSGARTYEPPALATHGTAANIGHLIDFYRLTGDPAFLSRIPEALEWLDAVKSPPDVMAIAFGQSHPTFVEVGTNKPLYVHRRGSNVINGEYYVNGDPRGTIGHYSSFRNVDTARLRQAYLAAKAQSPGELGARSPLRPDAPRVMPPKYFAVREAPAFGPAAMQSSPAERAARAVSSLDAEGRWIGPLGSTSHPYRGHGSKTVEPGDFSRTQVGDDSDTSPYRAGPDVVGISTGAFIRNMGDLIRWLDGAK